MPPAPIDRPRPKHLVADAEAPSWRASINRRRAAAAVGISMLALPVVVLDNLPDRSSAEAVEVVEATDTTATTAPPSTTTAPARPRIEASRLVTVEPSTTTTTEAPTTTTTAPPSTTTTARPTTTTAPPPPPTPPTAPPPTAPAPTGNAESGGATWYRHGAGLCAHKTLPFGTVVTVTSHASGATATCTVADRGPFTPGRIIDLDASVFEQLAPLSAGVIQVTITW